LNAAYTMVQHVGLNSLCSMPNVNHFISVTKHTCIYHTTCLTHEII